MALTAFLGHRRQDDTIDRAGKMNKRVVLVGAGHAHLHLLGNIGILLRLGAEVHVVAPEDFWYSGMATGMLGGLFAPEEDRIDIAALVEGSGAILHRSPMRGLDRAARRILIGGEQWLDFDVLSLNLGSTPPALPADNATLYPVKPVQSLAELRQRLERKGAGNRLAVIGGGVTGLEIAANLRAFDRSLRIAVFSQSEPLLQLPPGARRAMLRHLRASDVAIRWPASVARIDGQGVLLEDGERHDCDMVVNAAGLLPPPLTRNLGLAVAEDGGLITDPFLRSASDASIFAVGDCAAFDGKSLPRIGVYAVRQAPVLLRNIVATLQGRQPLPFKPQRHYLSIIGLGRSTALMVRGDWWFKGLPALWLKRRIDQRFVRTYRRRSIGVRTTRES